MEPVVAALVVGCDAPQKWGEGANNLTNGVQRQTKGNQNPSPLILLAGVVPPTGCSGKGKTPPSMMLVVVPHWALWQGEKDAIGTPKDTGEGAIHPGEQK
jgi:hypothetical protein